MTVERVHHWAICIVGAVAIVAFLEVWRLRKCKCDGGAGNG